MKKSLANKLSLFFSGVVLVTCLILVGITVLIFGNIRERMENVLYENTLESYKTEVKSEVQSALTEVSYYYNQYKDGVLDEEKAQKEALEVLRNFRYGDDNSGYIWVDAFDYTLVMHPILPENEGKNRYDLTDQNGVKIIQEIMKVKDVGGYNEFYFTKSDGVTVAPKVAYSKAFPEWEWVLTTGIYTDDIENIVAQSEGLLHIKNSFEKVSIFLFIIMLFIFWFIM